jgi:predicted dehydrogenase
MLRTAQMSLGWWGQQVTKCLTDSDVIEIVCGVDPMPASTEKYAAAFGLPTLADYDAVLADPKIDAVILTTPHGLHERQVVGAAAAGKQVFCEKPLSLESASVARMLDACRKAGIILGVGHERRFEEGWEEIKRMADAGELGTILHVEADFSHDRFLSMTADNWRGSKKEAPAAGMTGMGVHLTDMLLSLVGPIVEVHAIVARRIIPIETGDVVSVHLRFADGTTGHIAAVSATPYYGRLLVNGSLAWAEARDRQHVDPGGPVDFFTRKRGDAEQSTRVFEPRNVVKANYEEWTRAALGQGTYRFTDEERYGNVAVLEAIVASAEKGTPEKVAQYRP